MSNSLNEGFSPHPIFLGISLLLLLLSGLIISGCIEAGRRLDFETVDTGEMSGYTEKQAKFMVIAGNETWGTFWQSYMQGQKKDIDFDEYLVIAAFQGEKSTGGYGISIKEISQTGAVIDIIIEFIEPKKGEIVTEASTQPYHIIKLKKAQIEKGLITFRFLDNIRKELTRESINM
ncbi:MAG: protease complex subunit PrcB family protein [Nitrospirota bacterium]|nr:protease complex subunit PrcB family protein [Nitrospirota bacterium]